MAAHISRHLTLAAALLCSVVVSAQQPVPETLRSPSTAQQARDISVDVVVTPTTGVPVAGLQAQDLTVLDNKLPQTITSFEAIQSSQAPAEVVLLVDAVNADYHTIAYARGEIDKFLQANGAHLAYPTALAILTDTGVQIQPGFSSDGHALAAALDRQTIALRTIRQSTGFYGATERLDLSLTALHMLIAREAGRPGRKIVLWVSPGWPLLSGPGVELNDKTEHRLFSNIVSLSTEMRQARMTLYSIDPRGEADAGFHTFYYQAFAKGVKKPDQVHIGNLALQVLAVQSGGLALNSSNDIEGLLERCIGDTESYYRISFAAPRAEQPDEYHHLEVKVARPGLTARTRDGYYVQP